MPNYLRVVEEAGLLVEKLAPETAHKLAQEASTLLSQTKIGREVENLAQSERGKPAVPSRPVDVSDIWFEKLENRLAGQFQPRRLDSNPELFEKGGLMQFLTPNKIQVNLAIPSSKDIAVASDSALKNVFEANQQELLASMKGFNRGDFPPLGFHGTSIDGEAGIWKTRMGKRSSAGSSADGDFWLWTNSVESLKPEEYLSETQRALEMAGTYGGKTERRGAVFVTDASQQGWTFRGSNAGTQMVARDESQLAPHKPIDDFIGKSTDNLRKTQLHELLMPETFNNNVLGSFQINRRLLLDGQAKPFYIPQTAKEDLFAHALDLQISTAETFELAGLLQRTH